MTVILDAPRMYEVVSQSGKTYTVDVRAGSCDCRDAQHNLPTAGGRNTCKHVARVTYADGFRPVPAGVDRTAIDPLLGRHTENTPRLAATDGGTVAADADADADDGQDTLTGVIENNG